MSVGCALDSKSADLIGIQDTLTQLDFGLAQIKVVVTDFFESPNVARPVECCCQRVRYFRHIRTRWPNIGHRDKLGARSGGLLPQTMDQRK